MDAATLAAVCMLHAQNPVAYPLPSPVFDCGSIPARTARQLIAEAPGGLARLRPVVSTREARDAMARTVLAEAGNQGDSGMAGVVYTILNRLLDGRWGSTVEAVVDAPGQFEPVMRAGRSWQGLRPVSGAEEARVNTIVNLALDGRLPDLTHGARYFQNPAVVAARAQAGMVSASLVNFGGASPSAVIGAHAFYATRGPRSGSPHRAGAIHGRIAGDRAPAAIFVGDNHAGEYLATSAQHGAEGVGTASQSGAPDPGGAIFIRN